ncbi:hypothetical protein COBT_001481 [Conglomerata obtusa]
MVMTLIHLISTLILHVYGFGSIDNDIFYTEYTTRKQTNGLDLRDQHIETGQIEPSHIYNAKLQFLSYSKEYKNELKDVHALDFQSIIPKKNLVIYETQKRNKKLSNANTPREIKDSFFCSLTFKNFSSRYSEVISDFCGILKDSSNKQTPIKLAIFFVPLMKRFEDVEHVIRYECAHICNDYIRGNAYKTPFGFENSKIRNIILDIRKNIDISNLIKCILDKHMNKQTLVHFFLISYAQPQFLEYIQYLYENYFYRKIENYNYARLFIATDVKFEVFILEKGYVLERKRNFLYKSYDPSDDGKLTIYRPNFF